MKRLFFVVALVFGLVGCSDTDTLDIAVEQLLEEGDFEKVVESVNDSQQPEDSISYDAQMTIEQRLSQLWWIKEFSGVTEETALGLQAYHLITSDQQGPHFNNHYFVYPLETFDNHTKNYFNTTLDPQKFEFDETKETQQIVFQDGHYYVIAADYPGSLGLNLRKVVKLVKVTEDVFMAKYEDMYFDAIAYEKETGQIFDHANYTNNPIENWSADMQSFVELLATGTALLKQNGDSMALLFAQIDK